MLDILDGRLRVNGMVYRAALPAQVRIQAPSLHVVSFWPSCGCLAAANGIILMTSTACVLPFSRGPSESVRRAKHDPSPSPCHCHPTPSFGARCLQDILVLVADWSRRLCNLVVSAVPRASGCKRVLLQQPLAVICVDFLLRYACVWMCESIKKRGGPTRA